MADPAANVAEIENRVEAICELAETVCTLQKDAFDYFKKILSPALAMKWQLIVEEEVVGVDYISLTGTTLGLARGRDCASRPPCYFIVLSSLLLRMMLSGFAAT